MRNIMGSGSRSMVTHPERAVIYKNTEEYIVNIASKDDIILISGMAEGWDEAIAKVGLRNNIPYHVYIPTKDYGDYYWGRNSLTGHNRMAMFEELVAGADRVVHMEDIYGDYTWMTTGMKGPNYETSPGFFLHANMARNAIMVRDCTDALLYDPRSPGTRDAVARLRKAKRPFDVYPFRNLLAHPQLFQT